MSFSPSLNSLRPAAADDLLNNNEQDFLPPNLTTPMDVHLSETALEALRISNSPLKRKGTSADDAFTPKSKKIKVITRPAAARRPSRQYNDRLMPAPLYSQDRLVAAALFAIKEPTSPQTAQQILYGAKLKEALFPSPLTTSKYSFLKPTPPNPRITETYPIIPKSEIYSNCHSLKLDLPGLKDDFSSMPASYSSTADLLAFILTEQTFTDPLGIERMGTQIYYYAPQTKTTRTLFPENALYSDENRPVSITFNNTGNTLIFGKANGGVEAWSLAEPFPLKTLEINPAQSRHMPLKRITAVAVHHHKYYVGNVEGRLYVINSQTGVVENVYRPHSTLICNIVISPNGKYLATGSLDDHLIIHRLDSMDTIRLFRMRAGIRAIAFDPWSEGNIAVGGGHQDPRICIFNFLQELRSAIIEHQTDSQITNIIWAKKNRLVTTHQDGSYQITPLNLASNFPFGKSLKISTDCGRILFCGIRTIGGNNSLMCAGGNENITFFPLPAEPPKINTLVKKNFLSNGRYDGIR